MRGIDMPRPLPHEEIYARLGLSPIHGIGVFAIRPIPAGTDIFANDRVELVWVERADLAGLLPAERALYHDFGISRGTRIGCPVNFHNLTPGWYCNQPDEGHPPNVGADEAFAFRALRDIAAGEELTVRYAEFSDGPGA
jgi:hypothetical protein